MLNLKDIFSGTKRLVGLDIGSSSLKLAEVISTSHGYVLNRFLQIPLPKGIIVEGVLTDAKELSLRIKELFRNSGCKGKGIVTALSGNSVIVKKITLAQMDETELRDLIRDEAGKYLPFDNMDDVSYDFQILGENEYNPNQMDVIIVAAKKSDVNNYFDAITAADLDVTIMDVDSFALETMYEANYEFESNEIVVIINIGASITNINVIKGGMSIFTRNFTMGGNSILTVCRKNTEYRLKMRKKLRWKEFLALIRITRNLKAAFWSSPSRFAQKLKDQLIIFAQLLGENSSSMCFSPVDRQKFRDWQRIYRKG